MARGMEPSSPFARNSERRREVAAVRRDRRAAATVSLERRTESSSDQPLAASSAWALVALENDARRRAAIRDLTRWRAGLSAATCQPGNRQVRAMAREAGSALREREGAPPVAAKRDDAAHRAEPRAEPRRTATATGSSSRRCPTSIRRRGSATWLGRQSRLREWDIGPKRAPRFSLISTLSRPPKCEAKSTAPTTRSRSCAILETARKNLSSLRKAAPTSNMTIGARRFGCWANICATTTTRRCSRPPPIAGHYTRPRATSL